MKTYFVEAQPDHDFYGTYQAESHKDAAQMFLDANEITCTVDVWELIPADYPKAIAEAAVQFIRDETADCEQLCDPEWHGDWESAGTKIDKPDLLADLIAGALRNYEHMFPGSIDNRMQKSGDAVRIVAADNADHRDDAARRAWEESR